MRLLVWAGPATLREACEQQAIGRALQGYDESKGFVLHLPVGSRRLGAMSDPNVRQIA
jgi:hypothetical protein